MSDNGYLSGSSGSSGGGQVARRTVLRAVPMVAGGVLLGWAGAGSAARAWLRQPAGSDFPEPPVRRSDAGVLATTLDVRFTRTEIPGFKSVYTRTYEAMIPGPTLRVRPGDRLDLRQINGLPPNEGGQPANPNVPHDFNTFNLHTHGLHVDPTRIADNIFQEFQPAPAPGLPDPVYLSSITIPNDHPAGTFWYHPHHHGSTAVQLLGGMAGTLIVEGDIDQVPEIAAARDVVVCINELKLVNGRVPDLTDENTFRGVGSTFLVNGALHPTITLAPGEVARWRLINAGAFTVLPVRLQDHPLYQVAQDGITFMKPVPQASVRLAMGNRADVLVQAGSPGTYHLTADGVGLLMKMEVTGPPVPPMPLPDRLPGRPLELPDPTDTRTLSFAVHPRAFPGPFTTAFRILGTGETPPIDRARKQNDLRWGRFYPGHVNQQLQLGDVEEWTINNTGGHPFHLHTNHFLVTRMNGEQLNPPIWHDTVSSARGEVVFRVRFDDFIGRTVLHCHNLHHEDEGMMQIIEYLPPPL